MTDSKTQTDPKTDVTPYILDLWRKFLKKEKEIRKISLIIIDNQENTNYLYELRNKLVDLIEGCIPEQLKRNVYMYSTYGFVNNRKLPAFDENLEINISPKFNIDNMEIVKQIFESAPKIHSVTYSMYCPYYKYDPIVDIINSGTKTYQVDLIKFSSTVGYQDNDPELSYDQKTGKSTLEDRVLNLVIAIPECYSELVVEKEIVFVKDTESKTRKCLLPADEVIPNILASVIGEFLILNCIGYMDYIIKDDTDHHFRPISDLRQSIQEIAEYKIKECSYCEKTHYQTKIFKCSKCDVRFCKSCFDVTKHSKKCTKVSKTTNSS